ncbi:MAG: hypothetical protein ACRDUX_00435 [Mycobacterium sp.]
MTALRLTPAGTSRLAGGVFTGGLIALLAAAALPTLASAQCTGDCNGNGVVAINELISGVNIALGNAAVSTCTAMDANGNGAVTINELIAAVGSALNGCGTTSTPTSTSTSTPTPTTSAIGNTPTATRTIGGVCGNGVTDNNAGETCDDGNTVDNDGCPSNCHVATCAASEQRLRVNVNFDTLQPDVFLQGLTIYLRYPDGTIDVPGRDDSPPVLERVTSDLFAVTPRDFNYALRVLLLDPLLIGYDQGTAMTVVFDVCQGASAPPVSAIACTIESATDIDFGDVPPNQVSCTLATAP